MAKNDNLSDFFQDLVDTIRIKIPDVGDKVKPSEIEGIIDDYDVESVGGFYEEVVCAIESGIKEVRSVVVYNGVETIAPNAYQGMTSLTNVKMFDTVKSIGNFAFGSCQSLKKIEFPKAIETLRPNAFNGCTALEKVTFSNEKSAGVEIGGACFSNCKNLQDVHFSRVKKISKKAFSGCVGITKVVILNQDSLPTLEEEAFLGVPTTSTFYVSNNLLNAWKDALESYGITDVKVYTSNGSNDGNID